MLYVMICVYCSSSVGASAANVSSSISRPNEVSGDKNLPCGAPPLPPKTYLKKKVLPLRCFFFLSFAITEGKETCDANANVTNAKLLRFLEGKVALCAILV